MDALRRLARRLPQCSRRHKHDPTTADSINKPSQCPLPHYQAGNLTQELLHLRQLRHHGTLGRLSMTRQPCSKPGMVLSCRTLVGRIDTTGPRIESALATVNWLPRLMRSGCVSYFEPPHASRPCLFFCQCSLLSEEPKTPTRDDATLAHPQSEVHNRPTCVHCTLFLCVPGETNGG